jgi:hypothetical protein
MTECFCESFVLPSLILTPNLSLSAVQITLPSPGRLGTHFEGSRDRTAPSPVFRYAKSPVCENLFLVAARHVANRRMRWHTGFSGIAASSRRIKYSTVTDMVCAVARRMGDGNKGCVKAFVNQKLHVDPAIFRRWRVVQTAFRFAQGREAGRPRRGKACR